MTALENKIQELWFLVISPVEMEKEIKAKCQAINILGGNVDVEGMLSLAKKVQPLAKNCYNLEIPMGKILESIPEDLGSEDLADDVSWHLASVREDVEYRIQSVEEELGKLHSALWLVQNDIKESLAKISCGLIPPHIDTLVDSKYGCMTSEFADEILLSLREKTIDSGTPELKIDDLRFQMSSDGKELISDAVTYRFVCGGTDDVVSRASFYDAILNANLISKRHGLQPVYRIEIKNPETENSFSEKIFPLLKMISVNDLTYENFGTRLNEEDQEILASFFKYNYDLGFIDLGYDPNEYDLEREQDYYKDETEYPYCYFKLEAIQRKVDELDFYYKMKFPVLERKGVDIFINNDANGYQLILEKDHQKHPQLEEKNVDLIFGDIHETASRKSYYGWMCGWVVSTKEVETSWDLGYLKTTRDFGFRLKRRI